MVVYSSLCVLSSLIIGTVSAQVPPNTNDQAYAHTHDYDFDEEDLFYNDILLDDEALEDAGEVADEVTLWTTVQLATTVTPSQTHTEHTTVYYTPARELTPVVDGTVPSNSHAPPAATAEGLGQASVPPLDAASPAHFPPNPHRQVLSAPVSSAIVAKAAPVQAPAKPIRAQVPNQSPSPSLVPTKTEAVRQKKDKIFSTGTLANSPTPAPHHMRQVVITRPANPPHIAKAREPVTVTTTVMAGGPIDIEAVNAINLERARQRAKAAPEPHHSVNVRAKEFKLMPVKLTAADTAADDPAQDAIDDQYGCSTGQAIADAIGNSIKDDDSSDADNTSDTESSTDSSDTASDSSSTPCASTTSTPACSTPEPSPACPTQDETPECPVEDDTPDCPVEDDTPDCPVEDNSLDCPVEDDTPDECPVEDDTPDCPVEDDTPDCPVEEDIPNCAPPPPPPCGCGGPTVLDVGAGCGNFEHQYGDDTMDFILDTKDHIRDRFASAKENTKAALSHFRPHHVHERVHQVLHDKRPEKSDQHHDLHDRKGHVARQHHYATYERSKRAKKAQRARVLKAAACDPCAAPVEEDTCEPAPKLLRTRHQRPRKAIKDTCNVCQAPVNDCCCAPPPPPPVKAKKAACGCGAAPAAKTKKDACSPPPVALPPPVKAAKPKKDTCPALAAKVKKDSCNLCNPPAKARKETCDAPPQKLVRPKKAAKKDSCGCAPPPPVKDTCDCAPPPVKAACGCGGPTMLDVGSGCGDFEHQYGDDTMDFILDTKDHVRGWWGNAKLRTKQMLSHASPRHIHSRISQLLHDKRPIASDQHFDLHDRKGRSPSRRDRGCGC